MEREREKTGKKVTLKLQFIFLIRAHSPRAVSKRVAHAHMHIRVCRAFECVFSSL